MGRGGWRQCKVGGLVEMEAVWMGEGEGEGVLCRVVCLFVC